MLQDAVLDSSQVSLAEPDTTFGFPEVRVGGLPAVDLAWLHHVPAQN